MNPALTSPSPTFPSGGDRSVVAQLAVHLQSCCSLGEKIDLLHDRLPSEPEPTESGLTCHCEAPSFDQLEADLQALKQAAEVVVDMRNLAVTAGGVAVAYDAIQTLQKRISTYETEIFDLTGNLHDARSEREDFRQRFHAAESKLDSLTSAFERLATVLPPTTIISGPPRSAPRQNPKPIQSHSKEASP